MGGRRTQCRAYREAGADLVFVDGIKTLDDLKRYAKKLGDLPLIYNGDLLPIDELKKYPFKITIHIGTMLTIFDAMRAAMTDLKHSGKLSVGSGSDLFEDFVQTMELGGLARHSRKNCSIRSPLPKGRGVKGEVLRD